MPHRNFSNYDKNLIEFLSYHHSSWTTHINQKASGIIIDYENLKDDYNNTLNHIILKLNLTKQKKELEKPFTQKQAKILSFLLKAANKLKLYWFIDKFNFFKKIKKSSSVPPNTKLKFNLQKEDKDLIEKIYKNY